jgi:hypothetical protein
MGLGWDVSVYRQADGGSSPATFDAQRGALVAVWEAGLFGLDWLDELVAAGKAINLGAEVLTCRYTARAEHLLPRITAEVRKKIAAIDGTTGAGCRPDEWLLVVAWDQS